MKKIEDVKNELTQKGIEFENGNTKGWSENSLIIDGGDCKVLVYVDEELVYHDLFEEGEYSEIFDSVNEETTTSYRGTCETVDELITELELD
jgi:hypothetical protein